MFNHRFSCFSGTFGFRPGSLRLVFKGEVGGRESAPDGGKAEKPKTLADQIADAIKMAQGQVLSMKGKLLQNDTSEADAMRLVRTKLGGVADKINDNIHKQNDIKFSDDPKTFAATASYLLQNYADAPGVVGKNSGEGVLRDIQEYNAPPSRPNPIPIQDAIAGLEYMINKPGKGTVKLSQEPKDFAEVAETIKNTPAYMALEGASDLIKAIDKYNHPEAPKDPAPIREKLAEIATYINDHREEDKGTVNFNGDVSNFGNYLNLLKTKYKGVEGSAEAIAALEGYSKGREIYDDKLWLDSKGFAKIAPQLLAKLGDSSKEAIEAVGTYIKKIEKLQRIQYGIFQVANERARMAQETVGTLNEAAGVVEESFKKNDKPHESGDPISSFGFNVARVKVDTDTPQKPAFVQVSPKDAAVPETSDTPDKPEVAKPVEIKELTPDGVALELASAALANPDKTFSTADVLKIIGQKNLKSLREFSNGNSRYSVDIPNPTPGKPQISAMIEIARNNGGKGIPVALRIVWNEQLGNASTPHTSKVALQDFVSFRKNDGSTGITDNEKIVVWPQEEEMKLKERPKNPDEVILADLTNPDTAAGTTLEFSDKTGKRFKIVKQTNLVVAAEQFSIGEVKPSVNGGNTMGVNLEKSSDDALVVKKVNTTDLGKLLREKDIPLVGAHEDPSEEVEKKLNLNSINILVESLLQMDILSHDDAEMEHKRNLTLAQIGVLMEKIMKTKSFKEEDLPLTKINNAIIKDGGIQSFTIKTEKQPDGSVKRLLIFNSRVKAYEVPLHALEESSSTKKIANEADLSPKEREIQKTFDFRKLISLASDMNAYPDNDQNLEAKRRTTLSQMGKELERLITIHGFEEKFIPWGKINTNTKGNGFNLIPELSTDGNLHGTLTFNANNKEYKQTLFVKKAEKLS